MTQTEREEEAKRTRRVALVFTHVLNADEMAYASGVPPPRPQHAALPQPGIRKEVSTRTRGACQS